MGSTFPPFSPEARAVGCKHESECHHSISLGGLALHSLCRSLLSWSRLKTVVQVTHGFTVGTSKYLWDETSLNSNDLVQNQRWVLCEFFCCWKYVLENGTTMYCSHTTYNGVWDTTTAGMMWGGSSWSKEIFISSYLYHTHILTLCMALEQWGHGSFSSLCWLLEYKNCYILKYTSFQLTK